MTRLAGSKLISRVLLLISSVSVFSLLALTKCGLGGLIDDSDPSLMGEGNITSNLKAESKIYVKICILYLSRLVKDRSKFRYAKTTKTT